MKLPRRRFLHLVAGAELVHVPYRGGAAMFADLLGGQVQEVAMQERYPGKARDQLDGGN